MKVIDIYTDGACSYNPGPGGYGAILMYKGKMKKISGGDKNTTNNKMEILAVIKALECLKEPCKVNLYSDSAYVVNCFNDKWIDKWIANNWKKGKEQVKNVELWKRLYELVCYHEVHFIKVKGHSDNEFNNECDRLARAEVDKILGEINE